MTKVTFHDLDITFSAQTSCVIRHTQKSSDILTHPHISYPRSIVVPLSLYILYHSDVGVNVVRAHTRCACEGERSGH